MGQKTTRRAKRAAITGGVLAVTLAAAAPASAALGGANPANYNHVPDLRSVTFGSSGPDKIAWFTFDENLASNAIDPAQFTLGGYASSDRLPTANAASVVGTKPNTVELRWTSTSPDFDETTYGVVNAGAVRAFNGNQPNRVDSTSVTGAKGQDGTRGHSVAPDLVGVRVDESNLNANVLIYTFDQKIKGPVVAGAYGFLKQDGASVAGASIASLSDYEVAVRFPSLPGDSLVTEAVNGFVNVGSGTFAKNYASDADHQAAVTVLAVAGKSKSTAMPDLLSAELGSSGGSTSITFNFDEPVHNPIAGLINARTSTGKFVTATSAVVNADGKSITANYPNPIANQSQEHFVQGILFGGAVLNANNVPLFGDSAPIGGNAGALATGWTSAPDATSATFNKSNGQVDVTLDTRLTIPSVDPTQFSLIDNNGDLIVAGAASVVSQGSNGAPGPQTIRLQFLPNQVAVASAIEINGWNAGGLLGVPFFASLGGIDAPNSVPVAQSLSASASAAAIAPVGTPKSAFKLRRPKTVAVLPAKIRKALKPTKSAKRARANAKVLKAYALSTPKVKVVSVKKAAKKAGR
ncbi:hypothetical protein PAI11_21660 [Patulibacter medicamentivorans]|uniref:Uncharacterized protein n=1 Tax=Patulibacter medicamentivorans TaxID=1097667 RepID=H0E5R7_9ACTN|nr:hypothetical protein [Patulibacter medicamentivorans]EHN10968.1 hypothetical protein PAI11_21660 [Patulibacter medicamentivorans]